MGTDKYDSLPEDELLKLIDQIELCIDKVRQAALFSKNEELDDIQTETIKVR